MGFPDESNHHVKHLSFNDLGEVLLPAEQFTESNHTKSSPHKTLIKYIKMRALLFLSVTVALCVSTCYTADLILGTAYNNRLIWQHKANYNAVPFIKRVKEVFYSEPGQQIIKGIIARDLDNTKSSASITAGGVGTSFCNIRLKSERGSGLNYQIEIYV